jgi:hypothetical protein
MAAPDAKKIGAMVVEGLPGPDELASMKDGEAGEGDAGDEDAQTGVSAISDFFAAGKSGDWKGAWNALSDAIDIARKDDQNDQKNG